MRWVRKILFYLFAAAYLIGCPWTIAYALGYLYEPGTEHGLVQTGLIALSSEPPGATVYLNNKRYTGKTPAILRGLLPGGYQVRVALRDHRSWSRTVTVEGTRAAAYEHILLTPAAWRPAVVLAEPFAQLIPLFGDRYGLLLAGPTLGEAMVLDVRAEPLRPLLPVLSPWRQARLIDQLPVSGAPALVARVEVRGAERLVWIDVRGEETAIEDLSRFLLTRPVWAMAHANGKRRFVLFEDGTLVSLDDGAPGGPLAVGLRGAGLAGRWIYLLRASGVLERMDVDGRDRALLLQDAPLARSLFGARGLFRIMVPGEPFLLFWGEQGTLFGTRLPYRFAREGITGLVPDPRTPRVLLWRRNAVGVLDYSDPEVEPAAVERGPRLRWLAKHLSRVEQAYWVYEGSHVLLRDGDTLRLVEAAPGAPAAPVDLVEVKHKSGILYDEPDGAAYFLSADEGHLMRLAITPARARPPLPRPDWRELNAPPGARR